MPPDGVIKTRIAFEQLLAGASATRSAFRSRCRSRDKREEVEAGQQILADIAAGRFRSVPVFQRPRAEHHQLPELPPGGERGVHRAGAKVKRDDALREAEYDITIAVMGCRVNGPGETDDADLGLWCAPNFVNLKRGEEELGAFPYDTVLDRLKVELDAIIEQKKLAGATA